MTNSTNNEATPSYEAPHLTLIGSVHELTLGCDKTYGSSDGFTFQGQSTVCGSS